QAGESLQIMVDHQKVTLPVNLETSLGRGLVGFPVGLPGTPRLNPPLTELQINRVKGESEGLA
ncbi:MAG: hypothetical protein P8Z00_21875, partial [Anaerolineales bacterium]